MSNLQELPKSGELCYVCNFKDDWYTRNFLRVSEKNGIFKYITYDSRTDEVEEWMNIQLKKN